MTELPRVVLLTVVHRPDDARIYEREARALAKAGYNVTYLAPGATAGRDEHGVRLSSLPVRPRSQRWMSVSDVVSALRTLRPFVVHTHDPELLTLFPLLRPFVPRLVHDAHEFVREQVMSKEYIPAGLRPIVGSASGVAQRGLTRWADGFVTVTEDVLKDVNPRVRLRLVAPNYPRLSHFAGAMPFPDLTEDARLRLIHIGALSRSRGIALMLDVMERLGPREAVLTLGGPFSSREFEDEITTRLRAGLDDRVRLLGRVARTDLPRYLASAEVVWNAALPTAQFLRPTVATKDFEGAAVGLAVLESDLPGRRLVVDEGGMVVSPSIEGHLDGLRRLIAERASIAAMGEAAGSLCAIDSHGNVWRRVFSTSMIGFARPERGTEGGNAYGNAEGVGAGG